MLAKLYLCYAYDRVTRSYLFLIAFAGESYRHKNKPGPAKQHRPTGPT